MTGRTAPIRLAFTVVEMLVVVALIAVIAGLTLPRLGTMARREAVITAEQLADMLTLFAHRESMGESNIAIGYDPDAATIMMMTLVGDPTVPGDPPRWIIDDHVSPVILPEDVSVAGVLRDGRPVERDDWFIPAVAGQGRPSIQIVLESPDVERIVHLPQHALSARLLRPGDRDDGLTPIDLTALGRDREIW